jgi:hypothetical protein
MQHPFATQASPDVYSNPRSLKRLLQRPYASVDAWPTRRALLLASTPCWTAHDLMVGSLPGIVADLLSMMIGAAMLLRHLPSPSTANL